MGEYIESDPTDKKKHRHSLLPMTVLLSLLVAVMDGMGYVDGTF
jgi:hypothetical protein